MPDDPVISVGDMIDRGPRSKEVLAWFVKHGQAVLGNHEHLMLSAYYSRSSEQVFSWVGTGGQATLDSFGLQPEAIGKLPESIIQWVAQLPLYIESHGAFISHAPKDPSVKLPMSQDDPDYSEKLKKFVWNRNQPKRGIRYQIFGHNSHFGLKRFEDERGEFAICLDSSWQSTLTGINWPSGTIFQQPYVD